MSSGNVLFFNDVTPDLFAPWEGYAPNMAGYVTVPYNANSLLAPQQSGQAAERQRQLGARQPPGQHGRKLLADQ